MSTEKIQNIYISIDTSDLSQISEKDSKAPTLKELRKVLGMN